MENQTNKRLSDVTREASTSRANKFADSIMPAAPKSKQESPVQESAAAVINESQQAPVQPIVNTPAAVPIPVVATATPTKPERARKQGGFSVEDIINGPGKEGDGFNKMVRVTDDHHELLRLMAFKYRKPMNVIVHNLIGLLDQAYQKENKGDSNDV